jgi:hypothetical protein
MRISSFVKIGSGIQKFKGGGDSHGDNEAIT